MTENEISREVVDAAYRIHSRYGPGLLESAYEAMLAHELRSRGLNLQRQKEIPIIYDGVRLDVAFRADIVVNEKVILELKSIEQVLPVHKKQLLTYLRLSGLKLGILLNFGERLIRDGIHRVVNGL